MTGHHHANSSTSKNKFTEKRNQSTITGKGNQNETAGNNYTVYPGFGGGKAPSMCSGALDGSKIAGINDLSQTGFLENSGSNLLGETGKSKAWKTSEKKSFVPNKFGNVGEILLGPNSESQVFGYASNDNLIACTTGVNDQRLNQSVCSYAGKGTHKKTNSLGFNWAHAHLDFEKHIFPKERMSLIQD